MTDWKGGKLIISCAQCGLDRGKEVGGLGTACPKCGFKPEQEREVCLKPDCTKCLQRFDYQIMWFCPEGKARKQTVDEDELQK